VYEQETVLTYVATSNCGGREVDHIFESHSDDDALDFATSQGWWFVEQAQTEIVFTPDERVLN